MITAIVFIHTDVAVISETAAQIANISGVSEVYSVTGGIDLVTILKVDQLSDVAKLVTEQINRITGVMDTETHVAFQTFSQADLESGFSIGD